MAERLFDNDPHRAHRGLRHAMRAEAMHDVGEVLGRGGEIKQPIPARAIIAVVLLQQFFQRGVAVVIVKVHGVITDLARELIELLVALVDPPNSRIPSRISFANALPRSRRATPTMRKCWGSRPDCSR